MFPFGFGLSYTTFAYSDLRLNTTSIKDTERLGVTVKVRNTGRVAGKEVVQLYVHEQDAQVMRPEKELKAFAKVALEPGEEKIVQFESEQARFCLLRCFPSRLGRQWRQIRRACRRFFDALP